MQERQRQYGRSPYLSALKTKDGPFLPKIHRGETQDKNQTKSKSNRRNNYNQSIFKGKQQKFQMAKIQQMDIQKILNSKEYKQMEQQLELMEKKFVQEINEIEDRKQQVSVKIDKHKADSYKNKYSLWELKNQILELENIMKDQQNQLQRLEFQMGYKQDQSESDNSGQDNLQP